MRPNAWPGNVFPYTEGVVDEYRYRIKTIDIMGGGLPQNGSPPFYIRKGGLHLKQKEQTIMETEILGREHVGYAYIYPLDGSRRQEYAFDMTPENVANFIGAHQHDADKIVLTDIMDNLILDTTGGFILNCSDQNLCGRVLPLLAPIQMGRRKAKDIPVVSRAAFEAYAAQEDKPGTQ